MRPHLRDPRLVVERWVRSAALRLKALVDRDSAAGDVDEELQFHIDRQIAAGIAAGLDAEAARTAALRTFGGVQQRREDCEDLRGLHLWEALLLDVRYAARVLRHSRGFALGAVVILALGIGATTAVFSVVNAVLIEPLPYPEPDRIVQILSDSPTGTSTLASLPRFALWRDEINVFEEVAAWHAGPGINLRSGDRPEHLKAVNVSADYFKLFGATVLTGRTFSAAEDRQDGPPVAVLSYGLWRRRFGSDASILGTTIVLGGRSHEIVGILDPRFTPDPPADVWLPLRADPFSNDHTSYLQVAGRLKPGVTMAMAQNEVARSAAAFQLRFPFAIGPRESFIAVRLSDVIVGNVKPALQLLTGAVVFVLLIACANAASLLLSRAGLRRAEIATRAALGARRERLLRQLLSESILLALAGGALGLALGQAGVAALVAWGPAEIPRLARGVTLDGRVLSFTLAISMFTGIAFGLLPALSASRVDLTTAFRQGGTYGTPPGQRRLHTALIVGEMMLALVLLAGAGLMIRTFLAERAFDRGFKADHVLALDMALGDTHDQTSQIATLMRNVRLRLQDRANGSIVAMSRSLPVDAGIVLPFTIVNRPLFGTNLGGPYHGRADVQSISPAFFDVFRIALRSGRTFGELDTAGAPPVAIINESMARRYWNNPRRLEMKEQITIGASMGPPFADGPRRIVGIVADIADARTRWAEPVVYVPAAQLSNEMTAWNNRQFPLTWVVRTPIEPSLMRRAIEDELRGAAGGVPVARVRTMEEVMAAATARTNFTMTLFSIFAGIALILAGTGMYALMAYSVQQRTKELGIRIAFGARPADVCGAIVLHSARLAAVGVVLGTSVALVLTRLMVRLVFGIETWDPAVFVTVALLLTLVTLAAAFVPAYRGTRISPIEALQQGQ